MQYDPCAYHMPGEKRLLVVVVVVVKGPGPLGHPQASRGDDKRSWGLGWSDNWGCTSHQR